MAGVRGASARKGDLPVAVRFAGAATASMVAETCTLPLDFAKTRIQLHQRKALQSVSGERPPGGFGHVRNAVRTDGLRVLWSGLSPALTRQFMYSGGRVTLYARLRDFLTPKDRLAQQTRSDNRYYSAFGKADAFYMTQILAGGIVGASSAFIAVPFEMLKTRNQSPITGPEYRKRGMRSSLRRIVATDGVSGLYAGALPSIQRAFMLSAMELSTYDRAKAWVMRRFRLPDDVRSHVGASLITGIAVTLFVTPIDVIKVRMMAAVRDPHTNARAFTGMLDCARKLIRADGFVALYRGVVPIYARLGPGSMIMFVSLENVTPLYYSLYKKWIQPPTPY